MNNYFLLTLPKYNWTFGIRNEIGVKKKVLGWSPFKVMSVAHVIFPRWPIHYNTSSVFTSLVRDCWLPRACFFFMILASYTCATLLYCDLIIQLLAHGWWFSLGTPASSTTKTGRHDIAEILLKVALNTIIKLKSLLYI
jgi:hypothetical protein